MRIKISDLNRLLLAAAFTAGFAATAAATPITIEDAYHGGEDHNHGDVIGRDDFFDVDRAELSQAGTILTVDLFTSFAGRADQGLFAGSTFSGNGIGYGDLFLASSWNPAGTARYLPDNNATGTTWEYAFALDNRWGHGGTATLFALSGSNDQNALMSDDFMSGATYRNGQEVAVDTASQHVRALNRGDWSVNDGYLRFSMDLAGTDLSLDNGIALHWGPTCANDVIEGFATAQVPEPGSFALLLAGLLGIGAARRGRSTD